MKKALVFIGLLFQAVVAQVAEVMTYLALCTGKVCLVIMTILIAYILIFGNHNMDADVQVMNIIYSTYRLIHLGFVELGINPPEWVNSILAASCEG